MVLGFVSGLTEREFSAPGQTRTVMNCQGFYGVSGVEEPSERTAIPPPSNKLRRYWCQLDKRFTKWSCKWF